MYSTIAVPLDGSSFGECAIPMAVALARRSEAVLGLIHVREPAAPDSGAPSLDSRFDNDAEQVIRARMFALAASIEHDTGLTVEPVFLVGAVADTLQAYVADSGADLLVMASHARVGFSRTWLGSVATDLVYRSAAPLLLVRPDPDAPEGMQEAPDPLFHRVLVPLDGSFRAAEVLRHAAALGTPGETEYLLLKVCRPPNALALVPAAAAPVVRDSPAQLLADVRERAAAYLERVAAPLRRRGFGVTTHTAVHAHTGHAIVDFAGAHTADLIVLSTRVHSATERIMIGSVADKVMRGSTGPVLICGPRAEIARRNSDSRVARNEPPASGATTREHP